MQVDQEMLFEIILVSLELLKPLEGLFADLLPTRLPTTLTLRPSSMLAARLSPT